MKTKITNLIVLLFTIVIYSQEGNVVKVNLPSEEKYIFTTIVDVEASAVKSQGNTGTCWSYAGSSFLESEIFRNTGELIDLSEMYTVRQTYPTKAWNYIMRQGKIQYSEGGLGHDVLNSVKTYGLVPESAFTGLKMGIAKHDHSQIIPATKKILDAFIKNGKDSKYSNWSTSVDSILNIQLGNIPKTFNYKGISYTPKTFLKKTKIKTSDYVTLTSFLHQPFYSNFILNIPDNFSNGIFYNIPINELIAITDRALKKGYTIALDSDVSEKTFSSKNGIAIIPNNPENNTKGLTYIVKEKDITPEFRQQEFENYNTTDDHLMHIVGMVKDQKGNEYYKVKNSWGGNSKRIGNNGYVYMSKAFFKLKTISILVHKNGLNKSLKKSLNI